MPIILLIRFEEKELFPYIQALINISKKPLTVQKTVHLASNSDFSIHSFIEAHSCIEDETEDVSALIRCYSENQAVPLIS